MDGVLLGLRASRVPALLVVTWLLAAGPARASQNGDEKERLAREFIASLGQKEWLRAIEIGRSLKELDPENEIVDYNLACAYARAAKADEAIQSLRAAAKSGFSDADHLTADADLESVRAHAEFAAIVERVRKNHEQAREEFERKVEQSEPLIVIPGTVTADRPAPVVVALHPYGGTAETIAARWRKLAADRGAILVAPRAVLATGKGFQWGTVDQADRIVTRALERVRKLHPVDDKCIFLTGFSQGAFMAYGLGLRHAATFRGVIPMAGEWNPAAAALPKEPPAERPRFYIMVGDKDPALESNKQAALDLRGAGFVTQLKVFENLTHEFPPDADAELEQALRFCMGEE
ncbi:MAG: hypothetical protein HRF50_05025 [Phycisphaerae bacterium]